jgi:exoribonuclease R
MIEEIMLAANISVAEKILQHYPLCSLLRYTFAMSLLSCYILSRSDQI